MSSFFKVEDHLLFQPVRIDLDVELRQILADAGLDRLGARPFRRGTTSSFVAFDLVYAPQQVGDQRGALLQAEVVEPGDGLPPAASSAACSSSGTVSLGVETTSGIRSFDCIMASNEASIPA